jgi:LuxR family maltose regulon positive regulatory protein
MVKVVPSATEAGPVTILIRTKLHRPAVTRDVVARVALYDRLEEGRHLPLTLVSAPAGYGKSTLVSHWLESHPGPSAWVTLEETENDPPILLRYLVAAVRTIFPEACAETLGLLEAQVPVPMAEMAVCLCNELDDLETDFVLALDDYHRIGNPAVHDVLMGCLLDHMPRPLHLVIMTRVDPPLPLASLRAHHMMNEIRLKDLDFTEREAGTFLKQATGRWMSDRAIARVYGLVEGWPVGLRLTAEALRHQQDTNVFLQEFDGNTQQIQDFLLEEIVSRQPPHIRDHMESASILDRFCAPLCEAVWMTGDQVAGLAFEEFMEAKGTLLVPLDLKQEWHRYHHLLQELLRGRLAARFAPNEIASLHRRAAAWFEAQGLLEEAIEHALKAEGGEGVARLIVRRRNEILNGEQWHRLDHWLKHLLPAEVVDSDPELLMLKAWHLQNRGRYARAHAVVDRIDEMLADGTCKWCDAERLRGGINSLRSRQRYEEGHGELALELIEQALEQLPPDCLAERAYAFIHVGAALQMCGELEEARARLYAQLADTSIPTGTFQGRVLIILSLMNWIAGDLRALQLTGAQLFALGEEHGLAESIQFGRYLSGIAEYQRNELAKAEAALAPVVANHKVANLEFFAESGFALASLYQATGQAERARETIDSVCAFVLHARNPALLHAAQAYQADLALRQGRLSEAARWAEGFDPEPMRAMYQFYEPRFTLARVLIAQNSADSRKRADRLLTRLETFLAGIHATRFLIEVLALRALLHDAQGDEPAAREALGRAVSLALPGGFIRLFVDLGPELATLLNNLELDDEEQRYVGRILAAFQADRESQAGGPLEPRTTHNKPSAGPPPLPVAMTNRELEILGLLAERLSRQEIADRLHISNATVKRHAENIYSKLGVAGRRQAVAKAREIAILSGPIAGSA